MALRGTLDNLGLAGVLQLISQNGRHGVLTVDHNEHQANLYFLSGHLAGADGTGECALVSLGARLLAAGLIGSDALKELSQGAQEPITDSLVARGLLQPEVVGHYARLHSIETLQRVLAWPQGSYAFLPSEAAITPQHEGLRTDHLLMDALRAQDGWPALRARLPNRLAVFEVVRSLEDYLVGQSMSQSTALKSDGLGDISFDGLAQEENSDDTSGGLSHNDRLVYSLIDGVGDVQHVIDRSGLTAFDAMTALVTLLNAQLLQQTQRIAPERVQASTLLLAATPRVLIWRAQDAAIVLAQAAFAISVLCALWFGGQGLRQMEPKLAWERQLPYIMAELELVRARTGTYPVTLNTLDASVLGGLQSPLYGLDGAGYQLRPQGTP